MAEDVFLKPANHNNHNLRIPGALQDLARSALDEGRHIVVTGRLITPKEEVQKVLATLCDGEPVDLIESGHLLGGRAPLGARQVLVWPLASAEKCSVAQSVVPELRDDSLLVFVPVSGEGYGQRDVSILRP